jgi:hypothetical protein
MTKAELRDKIKTIAKQIHKPINKIDLDIMSPNEVSLESAKFPVLVKFPELKKTLTDLLTDQYEIFVSDIEWVAPRPTTFRIILGNNESFYLIFYNRSWIAQIEGKKYYLSDLNEEQRASKALARILSYGNPIEEKPEEAPIETPPIEEPQAEETPPEEKPL